MTHHHDLDVEDARLLAELRELFERVDPVPPALLTMAEAAFVLGDLDAELAAIAYDSAVDSDRLALVRGLSDTRLLTFEADSVTVELEAVVVGPRRRLIGQLVPPQPAEVEVRHRGGASATVADDIGRFVAGDVEPGPMSLLCRVSHPDGPVGVRTDWFVV